MNARYPASCTIFVALAMWASFCLAALGDETSFRVSLNQLADKCDELQLPEQAKVTRAWHIARDPQRHYLFLPQPQEHLHWIDLLC